MPALPLGHAGRYVAAAYVVFFGLVLIYVSIMAIKLSRLERELAELNELADRRLGPPAPGPTPERASERTADRAASATSAAEASAAAEPSAASAAPATGSGP